MVIFKSFQAVKPPEFKGSADPIEARAWLKEIEKAFALVKVGEDQKTEFASYYPKNEANYWGESMKALKGEEVIAWTRFTELFMEKYFPEYMQSMMELEFSELKQEEKSVAEYEARFVELARFVPSYVDSDIKKAKRFQHGLKPEIPSGVVVLQLKTYAAIIQTTMIIEGEQKLTQKEKDSRKRKVDSA